LWKNPVFMYFQDGFQKPNPFQPDVAVAIDDVMDRKFDMMDAHVSQFYEWLPWHEGMLDKVPKDPGERRQLLKQMWTWDAAIPAVRAALVKWYGPEAAPKIKYAEAFEICEYGSQPGEADLRRLFPFFPAK